MTPPIAKRADLMLVRDTLIDIDLIAYATKDGSNAQVVQSSGDPRPLVNYSEAVVAGELVFAEGQLATDFQTGVQEQARKHPGFPFYGSSIQLQTRYFLENCERTFAAAGPDLENVVRAQVFLTDLGDFHAFEEVWREYFPMPPPRTTIDTTGLPIRDALIEIDLIAAV